MGKKTNETFEGKYSSWETDDLITAITSDRNDYRPAVIEAMENEIAHCDVDHGYISELSERHKQDNIAKDESMYGVSG